MRLVGIASLSLLAGCPLVQVEADFAEVCVTHKDVHIPGTTDTSVSQSFSVDDLSAFHDLLELDADVAFVRAEVRPTSGVTDLSFVDSANVALNETPVFACDGNCPTLDHAAELFAATHENAAGYLAQDSIEVALDVAGHLPATEWTVDVDVCVTGHVTYSLEP